MLDYYKAAMELASNRTLSWVHSSVGIISIFDIQMSIIDWFLKNHVILKSQVMLYLFDKYRW